MCCAFYRYAERARLFDGWEEASRQYQRAEAEDFARREAMVAAMHASVEGKRLEEEESAAIERERAEERARGEGQRTARQGHGRRSKPRAHKDEV